MDALQPSIARKKIVELIGNAVYVTLGLKETLEDERRALESQELDGLQETLDQKSHCVTKLGALEEERKALCATAGFPIGPRQMEQMVEWCDESAVIANGWQHLMNLAVECNSLNTENGAIIRGRKTQIETGLSVIRGDDVTMATYNRQGREPGRQALRSIAQA